MLNVSMSVSIKGLQANRELDDKRPEFSLVAERPIPSVFHSPGLRVFHCSISKGCVRGFRSREFQFRIPTPFWRLPPISSRDPLLNRGNSIWFERKMKLAEGVKIA